MKKSNLLLADFLYMGIYKFKISPELKGARKNSKHGHVSNIDAHIIKKNLVKLFLIVVCFL